jgi:hypothetical protein
VRVSGVVTGPDGAPLAGIDVIASPSGLGTVTAADGTYTLAVLPGSDTLWFGDPTGACASGWYSTGGFTLDQSAAATLDLSGADVTGIDVQMPLASG